MSYRASNLPADKHVFLGRRGGVSEGKYASLNVRDRSSDDPRAVAENRRIAVEKLGMNPRQLVMLRQVSATDAVLVEQASQGVVEADGMVCKVPGLVLGIGTADCLPVLLAGILFGPWAGFVVGMVADIIGGVLAGYAINPLITLGAASIGLVGGLGWQKLSHLRTGNRLWCSVLAAHFVGSMVINSLALHIFYGYAWSVLIARIPNALVLTAVNTVLLRILLENRALMAVAKR